MIVRAGRPASRETPDPGGRTGGRSWRPTGAHVVGTVPAAALLLLFFVAPALWVLYASLTSLALSGFGGTRTEFIGLDNYRALWRDPNFPLVVRNSVVFVAGSAVVGQCGLGLALALLLDRARHLGLPLAPLAYAAALTAWVSPAVVSGVVWSRLLEYYHGALNEGLRGLGLPAVDWLGRYPMPAVIVVDVWRGTAFAMLIFLGALQTVPREVYEAAQLDGAGAWRRFWDHTLPTIRGMAALVLLMTTITTFGSFVLTLTLTNGGPAFLETTTLALYAYKSVFERFAIGYGSAIAVVMLALNLAFGLIFLRLARRRA